MTEARNTTRVQYRHLVGGEVRGRRHEVGDLVDPSTPPRKVQEWLKAGIIEPVRESKVKTERKKVKK